MRYAGWIGVFLAGCSGSGQPLVPDPQVNSVPVAAPAPAGAISGETPATPTPPTLPALGEAFTLDQGRLSVAGPEEWSRPPRDPKWLARFEATLGTSYPAILLQLPSDAPDQPDVNRDNAAEFAQRIQAELNAELAAKGLKVPEVKPLVLEHFAGVEYSRQAKLQGRAVQLDRLFLVTVAGGRRYTLELHAIHGTETQFRPYALAVANGWKFSPPTSFDPEAK